MRKSFILLSLTVTLLSTAIWAGCSPYNGTDDVAQSEDSSEGIFQSSDLSLFELNHRVKRVTSTTYYNVTPLGSDSVIVDTIPSRRLETIVFFDTLGHYVPRRDERITRDELGRIVRWDDRRPNLRRVHGGFLRDTLTYRHLSPNVVATSGMGDYAVTVYDDLNRVVGQYTDPLTEGEHTAVFNIYRNEDQRGNWTERLSVWTTQSPGSRPHVSYSLERREIIYY